MIQQIQRRSTRPFYYSSTFDPLTSDCKLAHLYYLGNADDYSGNSMDGVGTGVTFVTNGLEWDGVAGETVNVATDLTLAGTDDFTILAWVQCAATSTSTIQVILGMWDHTSSTIIYYAPRFHENSFEGLFYHGGNKYQGAKAYTSPNIESSWAGVWQLAGFHVKRDLSVKPSMSINGVFSVATTSTVDTVDCVFDTIQVGLLAELGGFPWKGIIGELYVYNSYKNAEFTLNLFNATKTRYGL